jgi:hypothetical protein
VQFELIPAYDIIKISSKNRSKESNEMDRHSKNGIHKLARIAYIVVIVSLSILTVISYKYDLGNNRATQSRSC